MKRQGFLLGLFSVGGQVLLLRELVSSLNGDELFIGTALFGWLMAVAMGAYFGGKNLHPRNPNRLFIVGAILLPVLIIAVRLSPLLITTVTGEVVPFSKAAVISMLAMCPLGMISGWLFPLISRPVIYPASDAIVIVYLFEGIGAFAGGVLIAVGAGTVLSTLAIAVILAVVVVVSLPKSNRMSLTLLSALVCVAAVLIGIYLIPGIDKRLDAVKYKSYDILASFDTPQGHQALLSRDSSMVLMSDNNIEATYPDFETAENQVVIPYAYNPAAEDFLFVGRPEFGIAQLCDSIIPMRLAAVDARPKVTSVVNAFLSSAGNIDWYVDDPVAYFSQKSSFTEFDIITINAGQPDNYHNGRYFTPEFLSAVRRWLADDGILCIPTGYDTDRYIAEEKQQALAIIYNSLKESFAHVAVWPGTMTVFLASDGNPLDLPLAEIVSRLDTSLIETRYISGDYLYDRLDPMKVERLMAAVSGSELIHMVEKPILIHYQARFRSMTDSIDRRLMNTIMGRPYWTIIIPLFLIILFIAMRRPREMPERFGLFLYFTAGVVSLSLELISFYIYQTMAGSLYSEMALLIGSFMLGLAIGTYYSQRAGDGPLQYPALIILLVSTILFLTMWNRIGPDALLPFHMFFLFVVAVATGTLFVAATNIYYGGEGQANRGIGYAWELAGSALGALFTLTILLPMIGLTWLLISLAALIVLALAGSMTPRKPVIRIP